MALPREVKIVDVGPRDGLQNEPGELPTRIKLELIERVITSYSIHYTKLYDQGLACAVGAVPANRDLTLALALPPALVCLGIARAEPLLRVRN